MLKVKKPYWRKTIIDDMFTKLDKVSLANKIPQARRQIKIKVLGEASNKSVAADTPTWVITGN